MAEPALKQAYDIVWESQSRNSQDSMPLGGYDVGCNVWVEDDQLCLYVSQTGAFDENGTMLKAGRFRMVLDQPELFRQNFRQQFHLYDGYISVQAGSEKDSVRFLLWADTKTSLVNIQYTSDKAHALKVFYDTWRYKPRDVPNSYERHQCRDYDYDYPGTVTTYPDVVEPAEHSVLFYHANREDALVTQKALAQQGLESIKEVIPDEQRGLVMGGILASDALAYVGCRPGSWCGIDQMEYEMRSDAVTALTLSITLHTGQYGRISCWKEDLVKKQKTQSSHDAVKKWWHDYFDRSYIVPDPKHTRDNFFEIGRNYQLFRYMLGCNYAGKFPTKFNGGLFTADNNFGYTADFRAWSGTIFTSQNQRLVYWPMLKTGDFQAMRPQFEFFRRITEVGKARVQHYWHHPGACFYEQGSITGLCSCSEYSWHRREGIDPGLEDNAYVKLHFSSALEFACMMLEYARYTGESIDEYLDFILSVVRFYFAHYPMDENGKLYIFPSTALESFKGKDPQSVDEEEYGCVNPMDVVAGLRCVLEQLISYLPDGAALEQCKNWLSVCPELPVAQYQGKTVFAPAESYEALQNCELPQLYRVYPYSPNGLSEDEKEIGRNTYHQKRAHPDQDLGYSWHQNGIFAARLSLTEEAIRYLHEKFDDAPRRFPAFWGPGHDYTPDHNHGGSGMIGLQEMLLQCEGDKLHLFPAWDCGIDVHFKLFAPEQTVVECTLEAGKVVQLSVDPPERQKDVVVHLA